MNIGKNNIGSPGSLYIPENNFSIRSVNEARKYLLKENGYSIRPWAKDIPAMDLANLKEEVIRKNFLFLSPTEIESLTTWHREKTINILQETFLAIHDQELVGIGALEEIDSECVMLSSGYGKKRGAVAALTALRISLAEKRGYKTIKGEVFRSNSSGRAHLQRWGFNLTGEARRSVTSNNWIDIWSKDLRTNE